MKEVVIVDGVRTPMATLGGALREIPAHKMAETVIRELVKRTKIDPKLVEEVILGCVVQTSDAPNVARVAALLAGLPIESTAYTVQRNCSSGLQSIVSAFQNIQCGDADVQIAGGVESMSRAPYVSRDLRFGRHLKDSVMVDSLWEGLTDPVVNQIMGRTAENLAEEFKIGREEQDQFAVDSHKKAFRAVREGKFKDEIVPVSIPKRAAGRAVAPEIFSQDEGPNPALTLQQLALYPTVFKEGGSVTPGNSCPLTDGAAAVLVMSLDKAKELGYKPLGVVRAYAFAGVEPDRMGIGPAHAAPKVLKKAGLKLEDIQLIEINEAFAAQVLAVDRMLHLNREILNVNGGAIALGHPVGMTGTRLTLTLLREMERRNLHVGLASMCVGGGLGGAVIVER